MNDLMTVVARVLALENGAELTATPGVVYDHTDTDLAAVAQALLEQFATTGIDLLAVQRQGATLLAHIDETNADEPLCPSAFDRTVRRLSYQLLGQVWDGQLDLDNSPSLTPAPAPTPTAPGALVRVA